MTKIRYHTPFFILGRERSGTTLLRVSLNGHSRIYIPPESPFIVNLLGKHKDALKPTEFVSDLKSDIYMKAWNIDYERLLNELRIISDPTYQEFCHTVLQHPKKSAAVIGDKNPTYSLFAKKLIALYPTAKFIWLIRDYRAQVNSMLKVNFQTKKVGALAARWVCYNQHIHQLEQRYPNQVLRVRYEDLVRLPEEGYKRICTFLGLEYETSVLSAKINESEFYAPHHTSLEEQASDKYVDEWKEGLTVKQIRVCQTVAGRYGEKFGYDKIGVKDSHLLVRPFQGVLFGRAYIPFIKLMYSMPFGWRKYFQKKFIEPSFSYWKEVKKEIEK